MPKNKQQPVKPYTVGVVDGAQVVNGRVVESVVDPHDRTCSVTDPGDRDRLASRSFKSGQVAQNLDHAATPPSPSDHVEIVDESAVLHDPALHRKRNGRRRGGRGGSRR